MLTENMARSRLFFIINFIIVLLLLIPRLDGFDYFPGKYLLAEDGVTFLNEAQTLGASAIFNPYNGYLHFYPRVIAYISSNFSMIYRPLITLGGWVISYLWLVYVISKAVQSINFGLFSSVALISLVALQPNYGENFFNLTNAQWMLGAILVIFALVDAEVMPEQKIVKLILLILLGLTGPFSIIIAPVILVNAFIKKDWKSNFLVYFVIFSCAIVQLLVLIGTGRATTGEINKSPFDWLFSLFQLLMFNASTVAVLCAAIFFWLLIFYSFIGQSSRTGYDRKKLLLPFMLVITAILFIFFSQYAHKQDPLGIATPGGGNRYTWIPYILIFFAALIVSMEMRIVHLAIILSALFICIQNFHGIKSPNLQFSSFARYSKFQEVVIPINPQWPVYPGWHIKGIPNAGSNEINIVSVDIFPESVFASGATVYFEDDVLYLNSMGNQPILILKKPILCKGGNDLAVEIYMTRDSEGWMRLLWSGTGNFREADSLRRWYPAGFVKAQFAFPNSGNGTYLLFNPMEVAGTTKINKIVGYCF